MTVTLSDIVDRLGGDLYGNAASVPGPGHSPRDRSLSLMMAEDGERIVFHEHSVRPAGWRAVKAYLGLSEESAPRQMTRRERDQLARRRAAERQKREAQNRETLAFCDRVWRDCSRLEGTTAETYNYRRGLIIETPDVRFLAAAPRSKVGAGIEPAQVALVRDGRGAPLKLHLTYLRPDGSGKSLRPPARQMFGRGEGGAVRLRAIGADGVLAVGEGIETSASFDALTGIPTWAALSTSGLKTFVAPAGIRKLVIAADADDRGDGLVAARALAERARERCDVEIRPAPSGQDWNDVLRGGHHA